MPTMLVDPDGRQADLVRAISTYASVEITNLLSGLSLQSFLGTKHLEGLERTIDNGEIIQNTRPQNPLLNRSNDGISEIWNNPITRAMVPDFISFGIGGSYIAGVGGTTSIQFQWVTRGSQASWCPALTLTQGMGGGMDLNATLNGNVGWFIGHPSMINRKMLIQNTVKGDFPTIWASGSFINGSYSHTKYGPIISIGGSIGTPWDIGSGSVGVSNTFLLYDFYNNN